MYEKDKNPYSVIFILTQAEFHGEKPQEIFEEDFYRKTFLFCFFVLTTRFYHKILFKLIFKVSNFHIE